MPCSALLCSPVAVHDGHAEGQEGIAPAALNRVQHVKQRGALQAAEQREAGKRGQENRSAGEECQALPAHALCNLPQASSRTGKQQVGSQEGRGQASERSLTLYQLHLSAGTLPFMFTPISPAARQAGRERDMEGDCL